MPETPDFDLITRRVMDDINACSPGARVAEVPTLFAFGPIKRALEEVWNARGAADARVVTLRLMELIGTASGGTYAEHVVRSLKEGDR